MVIESLQAFLELVNKGNCPQGLRIDLRSRAVNHFFGTLSGNLFANLVGAEGAKALAKALKSGCCP